VVLPDIGKHDGRDHSGVKIKKRLETAPFKTREFRESARRERRWEAQFAHPPHVTAVLSDEAGHGPSQRDGHIALIEAKGRLEWQKATGYGRRSLAETTMGRYKRIIGPQLRARSFAGQRTEAAIGVAVLNRMLGAGRPDSVRSSKKTP
jgi:hypothetical protein